MGAARPNKRKCLYLIETKERGNWTCKQNTIRTFRIYRWNLKEEVESLAEHPVEGGQVEEVGEGEGGAEQGLGDLWDHLVVKEDRVTNVEVDCGQCKNEGKRRTFPPQMSWRRFG